MSLATEKLKDAIRAQNTLEVTVLLTLAEKARNLDEWDQEPMDLALASRNVKLLEQVALYPKWNGDVLAKSYAQAIEKGWAAEAKVLLDAGNRKPFYEQKLHQEDVLRAAARHGWLTAIDHVMAQDPHLLSRRTSKPPSHRDNPLVIAIEARQGPAFRRLLQERLADPVLAEALNQAIGDDDVEALPLLWPRVFESQRRTALAQMVLCQHDASLDWVMRTFSPKEIRDQWSQDATQRLDTLVKSIQIGRDDLARALLPLVDPKQGRSAPLRAAVEQNNPDLIALLLPVSDPKAARSVWLHAATPRWDCVDRLGLHLPPEQKKAWLNRPEQMPQMLAAQRAAQGQETPPKAPARRRLRS